MTGKILLFKYKNDDGYHVEFLIDAIEIQKIQNIPEYAHHAKKVGKSLIKLIKSDDHGSTKTKNQNTFVAFSPTETVDKDTLDSYDLDELISYVPVLNDDDAYELYGHFTTWDAMVKSVVGFLSKYIQKGSIEECFVWDIVTGHEVIMETKVSEEALTNALSL
jgi:hypothetical protein